MLFGNGVALYLFIRIKFFFNVELVEINIIQRAAGEAFKMAVEGYIGVIADFIVFDGD
jgi:hypothetical protein